MRLSGLFAGLLASLVPCAFARSSTGDAVLVVLESSLKQEDFSGYFSSLERRGFKLSFRAPTDTEPALFKHDVPQFSHVVLFAPTTKTFADDLSPQGLYTLLEVEPTTNLIVALSPRSTPLSAFAAEFALGLPPPNTPLVSHFPPRSSSHKVVEAPPPSTPHPLLSKGLGPVLFEGQSHILGDNPLLFPILNAPAESYASEGVDDSSADDVFSASEKGGEGLWAGSKMSLVSGFQATNGARVVFAGGVQVFSDKFAESMISTGATSNAQFVDDVSAWAFQESLVYRVDNHTHYLAKDGVRREKYTTNDEITFTLKISQFDSNKDTWLPKSDIDDLQLEFTMLDPHIRTGLKPVSGKPGWYSVTFRAPDRHGVFKFVVNYKRKGLTPLHVAELIPIVPPRHDGYPRFLSAAYPYYAGALSTSLAFVLFCIVYLGGEAEDERKRASKGKGKVE